MNHDLAQIFSAGMSLFLQLIHAKCRNVGLPGKNGTTRMADKPLRTSERTWRWEPFYALAALPRMKWTTSKIRPTTRAM